MIQWKNICLLFFLSYTSFAQENSEEYTKWNKIYTLVVQDIKSIESLKTKDFSLNLRLFELYSEKLSLLIDRESALRIHFLKSNNDRKLKQLKSLQLATMQKVKYYSNSIEIKAKDPNLIARINYFKAINYYQIKNTNGFINSLLKAKKFVRDKKLNYKIMLKLAEHYYIEKDYSKAIHYYKQVVNDSQDPWLTKHLFNLSWCYLKKQDFTRAISHLKQTWNLSKNDKYYQIGDQLLESILVFHAYAQLTADGVRYLNEEGLYTFTNLEKLLHYVFENGKRSDSFKILNLLDKIQETNEQILKNYTHKILIYRTEKKFPALQAELKKMPKLSISKDNKVKDAKEEFTTAFKSYTGYLQELVNSKNLLKEAQRKAYLRYIIRNFMQLRQISPEDKGRYYYYEGETFLSLKKYKNATNKYFMAIKYLDRNNTKDTEFLQKSYNAIFKSLEQSPNDKYLMAVYTRYIKDFPSSKLLSKIYPRLILLYKSRNLPSKAMNTLEHYASDIKGDRPQQKTLCKELINRLSQKNDLKNLLAISNKIEHGFLNFTLVEKNKVKELLTVKFLEEYESLEKMKKYDEAINGFHSILKNKSLPRSLRTTSLRKILSIQFKTKNSEGMSKFLALSLSYFTPQELKVYNNDIKTYIFELCRIGKDRECLSNLEAFAARNKKHIHNDVHELLFKQYLSFKKLDKAYPLIQNFDDLQYFFQKLLILDPSYKNSWYAKIINHPYDPKKILFNNLELMMKNNVWRTYFNTLSLSLIRKTIHDLSIKSVQIHFITIFKEFQNSLKQVESFTLALPPRGETITFEQYGEYFNKLNQYVLKKISELDKSLNMIHPNFIPALIHQFTKTAQEDLAKIKNFTPATKDQELNKAVKAELVNWCLTFSKTLMKYHQFQDQIKHKRLQLVGSEKYNSTSQTIPIDSVTWESLIWLF